MAECHPVGYQWVTEARPKGAKVIHVDPRFTRTSATRDKHIPIRAGSDVVLLGALINHVLDNDLYFKEYVVAYTNAATLVSEEFRDTEDLDGLFSGYDDETGQLRPVDAGPTPARGRRRRHRAPSAARGRPRARRQHVRARGRRRARQRRPGSGARPGAARRDPAGPAHGLPDPQAALRPLHPGDGGATPAASASTTSTTSRRPITENSGRDRTTASPTPSAGPSTRSGAQFIRTAAILQLLLGNMGRPGGGIMALRGHASIQGSTDIPTLYNILPGYLADAHGRPARHVGRLPRRHRQQGAEGLLGQRRHVCRQPAQGVVGRGRDAPRTTGLRLPAAADRRRTAPTRRSMAMLDDEVEGYFLLGQNPAVGSAHGRMQRLGMSHLKWLVVRDLNMIESATFWKDGPEIASGELRTEDIETEVFFLPAATPRREGRVVHPDPADAAVAPQGGRAAGRLPERAAVLLRARQADPRSCWPTPPTSGTVRCST